MKAILTKLGGMYSVPVDGHEDPLVFQLVKITSKPLHTVRTFRARRKAKETRYLKVLIQRFDICRRTVDENENLTTLTVLPPEHGALEELCRCQAHCILVQC